MDELLLFMYVNNISSLRSEFLRFARKIIIKLFKKGY
nr:MAG TPA: hypothetical protein [Crassvirales sp.]DAL21837.1 MAG TPA_asm: hypothetical protein [Caudoviricetes sp.]DAX04717.1 MAG TPA: hypothetical protein [Bacteriophage sp.]